MILDLNKVSADQIADLAITDVGPDTAAAIVDERDANGPFEDWADLMARVPGVTAGIGQEIRAAGITIGDGPGEGDRQEAGRGEGA